MEEEEGDKKVVEEEHKENAKKARKAGADEGPEGRNRLTSAGSKPVLDSLENSDNIDERIRNIDNDGPEEKMSEVLAVENGDKSVEDSQFDSKSHSEDKVILFESSTYMREMQLIDENKDRTSKSKSENLTRCMQKRNLIALLSFFGFFNVYCLRVDLSITLVAMTNPHTRINLLGEEFVVSFVLCRIKWIDKKYYASDFALNDCRTF